MTVSSGLKISGRYVDPDGLAIPLVPLGAVAAGTEAGGVALGAFIAVGKAIAAGAATLGAAAAIAYRCYKPWQPLLKYAGNVWGLASGLTSLFAGDSAPGPQGPTATPTPGNTPTPPDEPSPKPGPTNTPTPVSPQPEPRPQPGPTPTPGS